MAKNTITHTCGHDETHQLYGTSRERDSKFAWLEGRECSTCYLLKRQASQDATNAAAAEAAGLRGLPALLGSERQVAWAETLRLAALGRFEVAEAQHTARVAEHNLSAAAVAEVEDALALVGSELQGQTQSKWWIDNRSTSREVGSLAWVKEQIRERGLTPTLVAEVEAREQARLQAERDTRVRNAQRLEALTTLRIDAATVSQPTPQGYLVVDGPIRLEYRNYSWSLADADGEVPGVTQRDLDAKRPGYRGELVAALNEAATQAANRRRADVLASLVGVAVAVAEANKKRSSNLTVTLADGRTATGHHTAKATVIETVAGVEISPTHPEAIRLATEVRKVVTRV